MTKEYNVQLLFRKEDISDEEYEDLIEEIDGLGDDAGIEARKEQFEEVQLSETAAAISLSAATLAVNGTDLLISLYQIVQSHPAFGRASIQDGSGEAIKTLNRDHIEAGSIEEEAIIGTVEGDVNIEGDVYLVPESEVDWMEIARGSEESKEE